MIALSAAAPPGGCSDRVKVMAIIATETAMPAARNGWPTSLPTTTPTSAEIVLPKTIGQGWARGLAGITNNNTADAPIGATMNGK